MIFTLSVKTCKNQSTAQIFFLIYAVLAPYATMSSSANKPNFWLLRCPLKLNYFFFFV